MEKVKAQKSKKITKVTLVIYFILMLCIFAGLMTASAIIPNYSLVYAFLLCLGPSIMFVLLSIFFPTTSIVEAKMGKGAIAWFIVSYILKYAAIIGIPFIGLFNKENFNNWVMLATTLIAPITVIIYKLIFANYVSKEQ